MDSILTENAFVTYIWKFSSFKALRSVSLQIDYFVIHRASKTKCQIAILRILTKTHFSSSAFNLITKIFELLKC